MAEPNDPTDQAKKAASMFEDLRPGDVEPTTVAINELRAAVASLIEQQQLLATVTANLSRIQADQLKVFQEHGDVTEKLKQAKEALKDEERQGINQNPAVTGALKDQIKLLEELKKAQGDRVLQIAELTGKQGELNKKVNEFTEARSEAEGKISGLGLDPKKITKDFDGALASLDEAGASINTIQGALNKGIGSGGGFLGQIYRSATSAMESVSQLGTAARNAGGIGKMLGNSFKLATKSVGGLGGVAKIAGLALVASLAKMALSVSNLSRELGAATGFGDQFNNEITRMAQKGNMAGIGFKESADALKSLAENVSSFNPTAEKTNEHMGLTVARLQKLGVASAASAKTMDFLQRTMNLTGKAAADMTAQLARMGKEIGITGTKMIEQFNSASGRLAIFGNRNIKVFKGLAAAAKASGIEIQSLIKISQQFDTFDKAADQAAKLNAVLGTQLSTLELMNASDEERVMMVKQQVQASVGNFDSLDKFTKMYIAQAMGVSDVAEAQRLLNMSTAEYQKYQQGQQEQADIQAELAEATAELVPMMQQLKLAATQVLLIFKPVITLFSMGIKVISAIVTKIGEFATFLGLAGGEFDIFGELVVGGLMLMGIAFLAFGAKVAIATGGISLLIPALAALFGVFHKKGSPELWDLPNHAAAGYENMANSMGAAAMAADATSASLKGVHDSFHKAGGQNFSIEAMAKLDTDKIASGITKVKSALMQLSTLKIDGFLAMTTDGVSTSMIMGSKGLISKISEGKLTVDVKMPDFKMPDINVKVFIGNKEFQTYVRTEAAAVVGSGNA